MTAGRGAARRSRGETAGADFERTGQETERGAAPQGDPRAEVLLGEILANDSTGRLRLCGPGIGLSLESDLLRGALADGRDLDAVMLERIVFGTCVPSRLGEGAGVEQ